jgi:glycosyltransferase involved in cell wall biosynthesis
MSALSLTVITWNRAETLRKSLTAYLELESPGEWELIVVDNGSTDHTRTVIESFVDRLPIRYVYEPQPGTCAARNRGIQESRFDLLVFTDDDITPTPGWLAAYARTAMLHPQADYFGGDIRLDFSAKSPPPEWLSAENQLFDWLAVGMAEFNPHHVERLGLRASNGSSWLYFGGNMGFRRRFFERYGRFDLRLGHTRTQRFATEEPFLQKAAYEQGAIPQYVADAAVYHRIRADELTPPSRLRNAWARGRASALMAYLRKEDVPINRWRYGRRLKGGLTEGIRWVRADSLTRFKCRLTLTHQWGYEWQMLQLIRAGLRKADR